MTTSSMDRAWTVVVSQDNYTPGGPWFDPITFAFSDTHEANEFAEHVRTLYRLPVTITDQATDTYDSAIQHLVEAIGPSPD